MDPNQKRQAYDAQRLRHVGALADMARKQLYQLQVDVEASSVEDPHHLVDALLGLVERWESELGQLGLSNHIQDGTLTSGDPADGGRFMFRIVPRLAAWVREIQGKAGKHGMLRVIDRDGRTFLEPTKKG